MTTTCPTAGQNYYSDERDRGYPRPTTALLVLPVALAISGLTGTSTGGSEILIPPAVEYTYRGEFAQVAVVSGLTSWGETDVSVVPSPARTDSEEVLWLKEHSGLTWDQLGKAFGVSRRAVHMWSSGGRLNESNARRLREFGAVVRRIEASTPKAVPETVRAALLAVGPDGVSVLDGLRRERSGGPTWGMPVSPESLIDAIHDPVGQVGQ